MTKAKPAYLTGYIEGYYGRLLTFADRNRIADRLKALGMTAYLYAPKEDPYHRYNWREPYPDHYLAEWERFAERLEAGGLTLIAGMAPGLDFDFSGTQDTKTLTMKLEQLTLDQSGTRIARPCLLLDDIDPPDDDANGEAEGKRHGELANRLADALDEALLITPRVYADEIASHSPGYLDGLAKSLNPDHQIFYCGRHIVADDTNLDDTAITAANFAPARLVVWDNLYANDYCPRRLFLGAWNNGGKNRRSNKQRLDKQLAGIMLNPTGMIETDLLLLALANAGNDDSRRQQVFDEHQIPAAFHQVAAAFDRPPDPASPLASSSDWDISNGDMEAMLAALETLLWRWKSPLQREWYPFLMGLRGDLLMATGQADMLRRKKILPPPLYAMITNGTMP